MTQKGEDPVRWLSPGELWGGAKRSLIAKTIGDYVDRREVFAALDLKPRRRTIDDTETVWIDYVADVGDGYRAARAVALAQSNTIPPPVGGVFSLHAKDQTYPGETLILGGDQVYPTASLEAYRSRFVVPYDGLIEQRSKVYAIPGNHDWYDGLTAFSKLFIPGSSESLPGTIQQRSYWSFPIEGKRWSVWGLDFALSGSLDAPQYKHFNDVRQAIQQRDRPEGLVVCTAEPFWEKDQTEIWETINGLIPDNVESVLFLSGDKHYLAAWDDRHDAASRRQIATPAPSAVDSSHQVRDQLFVTAGGGGAYLSLTGDVPQLVLNDVSLDTIYPEDGYKRGPMSSAFLPTSWHPRGWGLLPVTALIYGAFGSVGRAASDLAASFALLDDPETPSRPAGLSDVIDYTTRDDGWGSTIQSFGREAFGSTAWWLLVAAAVVGLIGLAKRGLPRSNRGPLANGFLTVGCGVAHAAAHVLAIVLVTTAAMEVGASFDGSTATVLGYVFALLLGGAIVGNAVFVLYLAVASEFGVNLNETSTAIASQNHKNFVRLKFSTDDTLTVFLYVIDDTKQVFVEAETPPEQLKGVQDASGGPACRLLVSYELPLPGAPFERQSHSFPGHFRP